MNISNSIAAPSPAAQGVTWMTPASDMASIPDRRHFESAVASAQKEAESDADTVPVKESASVPQKVPKTKKKNASEQTIDAVAAQAIPAHAQAGAVAIVPAPVNVIDANETGNAASAIPMAPAGKTGAIPRHASAVDASISNASNEAQSITPEDILPASNASATPQGYGPAADAPINETINKLQSADPENISSIPNTSSLTEGVDRNALGNAIPKESSAFIDASRTMPECKSSPGPSMNETTDTSQSGHVNGAGPLHRITPLSQASSIAPPLSSSDLQAMADAFETSVRHFERTGANWVGNARFTLQSSALKGAEFQFVSDGKSLSILLTRFAAAPVPISRRQESQLSEILTRKLGRHVSLNLALSETESAEHMEQQ